MVSSNREIALEYGDTMWNHHDLERALTSLTPQLRTSGTAAHASQAGRWTDRTLAVGQYADLRS